MYALAADYCDFIDCNSGRYISSRYGRFGSRPAVCEVAPPVEPIRVPMSFVLAREYEQGLSQTLEEWGYILDKRELESCVNGYLRLDVGWDGYQGDPPTHKAIEDALVFLKSLPSSIRLPHPTVSGDGEVGFFWEDSNSYIDVVFPGDGVVYFYSKVSGEEVLGHDSVAPEGIPQKLLSVLHSQNKNAKA